MYDFFWCRAICSFLVCLFAAGNVERCFNCVSDSYWYLVYQFFINSIGLRLFSAASLFSDIFLMLNRYLEITRKKSCISRMSKTLVLYICICTPLPFAIPGLFLVKIVEGPQKGTFVKKAIDPPATPNLVLYYTELIFLFETVLPVFFLTFLNVVSVSKFRIRMQIHADLTHNQAQAKKAETRFTKMSFFLSTICIVSRILDMITTIIFRLTGLAPLMFTADYIALIKLLKSVTNFILYSAHALDGLIHLKMDKNIWKLVLKLLGRKQVSFSNQIKFYFM